MVQYPSCQDTRWTRQGRCVDSLSIPFCISLGFPIVVRHKNALNPDGLFFLQFHGGFSQALDRNRVSCRPECRASWRGPAGGRVQLVITDTVVSRPVPPTDLLFQA